MNPPKRPGVPETNLRPARLEEAEALANLHVASWRTAYRGIVPDEHLDNLSVDQRTARFKAILSGASVRQDWVFERGGQPVGWLSWCPSRDEDCDPGRVVEIAALYVHPSFFGQGIGYRLMEQAFSLFDEAGHFEEVTLWVLEANHRGRVFYERQGFRLDGTNKLWRGLGEIELTELRYRRSLSLPPST